MVPEEEGTTQATSFLDELRAVADDVRANAEKTLDVLGAGGKLAVRFKPPEGNEARERLGYIVARYRVGGSLSKEQELQLLVDCHDEILHRNGSGQRESYDPPLRFDAGDERWGGDCKTARECVEKLYNLDVQPLAISPVADTLVDWLQGIDTEMAARAEGKSESGAA